jgi:hypothetical protein
MRQQMHPQTNIGQREYITPEMKGETLVLNAEERIRE